MGGFVLRYVLWTGLLFGLFYVGGVSPLGAVAGWQTALTAWLVGQGIALFALPIQVHGDMLWLPGGTQLIIEETCNGLAPVFLLWAAVLAFPTGTGRKGRWLLIGYLLLTALNTVRIVAVAYGMTIDPESFDWTHDIVGRYGTGLLTLVLFWVFTLRAEVRPYGGTLSSPKLITCDKGQL